MVNTSEEAGDPYDSPLYEWMWLLNIACAFLAGFVFPASPPWLWAAALVGPFAVGVVLMGTIWNDPDNGPFVWMGGPFTAFQGLLAVGAAAGGASLRRERSAR